MTRPAYATLPTIFASLLALFAVGARADVLDGELEVRSAYINVDNGVFKLHTRVTYPVNEDIRQALADGVTLVFDIEAVVSRERRYWFDKDVVELTLRRELVYHAVSGRYVMREMPEGTQVSFATLEEALEALGTVDNWPVLVEPQIMPDARYRVSVRAGVRRGRMPDSLSTLIFWSDSWHRTSEWYSWSLPI